MAGQAWIIFLLLNHGFMQCAAFHYRCWQPKNLGRCNKSIPSWHYSFWRGKCVGFIYSGCGGNMNRFETEEECNRVCLPRHKPKDSVCSLQADHGVCTGYLPRWTYDHEKDTCTGFVYGGCRGNDNRFESCLQCMRRCSGRDHRLQHCILQTEKFNDEFYRAWDPE